MSAEFVEGNLARVTYQDIISPHRPGSPRVDIARIERTRGNTVLLRIMRITPAPGKLPTDNSSVTRIISFPKSYPGLTNITTGLANEIEPESANPPAQPRLPNF
jgi:hypothetical protein